MWVFPKIGVPPNHPFLIGFSIINHPFWGTPIFENTYVYVLYLFIHLLFPAHPSFIQLYIYTQISIHILILIHTSDSLFLSALPEMPATY